MKMRIVGITLFMILAIGFPAWALYCPNCGIQAPDDDKFCSHCGRGLPEPAAKTATIGVPPLVFTGSLGSPTTLTAPPAPQAFQVTTHYLLVNGFRIPRDGFFWIAEIAGDRARVWSISKDSLYGLVMGWVTLAELVKRSTWSPERTTYCVEPPPPTAEVVVVHERPYWRHWSPRPFIYRGSRRGGHHRDGFRRRR